MDFTNIPDDPFELLLSWLEEAKKEHGFNAYAVCIATTNKEYKVGNRHVLLKRVDKDGIIFSTNKHTRKSKDLTEVPKAAATFLWRYVKDNESITKQVRLEGNVIEISREDAEPIYQEIPYLFKLGMARGNKVKWANLKLKYGEQLEGDQEIDAKDLPQPASFVCYKVVPEIVNFYLAVGYDAGNYVNYEQNEDVWKYVKT